MKQTTVRVDIDLMRAAWRERAETGRTIQELLNEGLRIRLVQLGRLSDLSQAAPPPLLPSIAQPGKSG